MLWKSTQANRNPIFFSLPKAFLYAVLKFQGKIQIKSTIVFISARSICYSQPIAAIPAGSNVMAIPPR